MIPNNTAAFGRGRLNFQVLASSTDCSARATNFSTLHSERVQTPIFMPVGTHSMVRHVRFQDLRDTGAEILLSNTYHLHLKPGPEFFLKYGGLHKFTGWERSFLTDSGGFQIFCMPQSRKITEEGATFRSYINGDLIHLSPEQSIGTQKAIGSDIMMVLDECVPSTVDKSTAKTAMELTHRWAKRSLDARGESPQSMFGIVQGACYKDLRLESAKILSQMDFDGLAIGGLAVGESKEEREEHTQYCTEILPQDLPRYLMGVGTPIDLLEAVRRGVDMFDCIIPTAHAEQGVAYSFDGKTKLRRAVYREDDRPIDPCCSCSTCQNYSRGYLHHLLKSHEPTAASLIAVHNLHFYQKLTESFRGAILEDRFMNLYRDLAPRLVQDDPEFPPVIPTKKKKKDPRFLKGYSVQIIDGNAQIAPSIPAIRHSKNSIDNSALRECLDFCFESHSNNTSWKLLDLETGDGAGLMSLINVCQSHVAKHCEAQIHITSISDELTALELATKNPGHFPHIRHAAPSSLLKESKWTDGSEKIQAQHIQRKLPENIQNESLSNFCFWLPFETTAGEILNCAEKIFSFAYQQTNEEAWFVCAGCDAAKKALLMLSGWYVYEWKTKSQSENSICVASKKHSLLLEERSFAPDSSFLKKLCEAMECDASLREKLGERSVWDQLSSHPQLVAWSH